jgi:hypothetical protein
MSIASPLTRPSPLCRRVGIRISTFEACSGFTRVTAHRIAQPPKAAFVTRLRSSRLPNQTARQLPEQSTTLWVEPPSTGETRPRGALQNIALLVLVSIILGPLSLPALIAAGPSVHRNLANAPRKRKPHVRYPVRALF